MSGFRFNPPARPGWQARVLTPWAWLRARAIARKGPGHRAGVPVVALGALAGPVAAQSAVALTLAQGMGAAVHVLVPGPGLRRVAGSETDPVITAEALILAPFVPVWQGSDPVATLTAAEADGARAILWLADPADRRISPGARVFLVDAAHGFGNGLPWPAGPLALPLDIAMAEAAAVIVLGAGQAEAAARWGGIIGAERLFSAMLEPVQTGMAWPGLRVLAVTGASRARDFLPALRGTGALVLREVVLDDDQPLAPALLTRLAREARHLGAQLVTTEAEALRLPQALRREVLTLPLRAVLDRAEALRARL